MSHRLPALLFLSVDVAPQVAACWGVVDDCSLFCNFLRKMTFSFLPAGLPLCQEHRAGLCGALWPRQLRDSLLFCLGKGGAEGSTGVWC